MSYHRSKEGIKVEIDKLEKEILYFKGRKRAEARKEYFRLLKSCRKTCGLEESIYLLRNE